MLDQQKIDAPSINVFKFLKSKLLRITDNSVGLDPLSLRPLCCDYLSVRPYSINDITADCISCLL